MYLQENICSDVAADICGRKGFLERQVPLQTSPPLFEAALGHHSGRVGGAAPGTAEGGVVGLAGGAAAGLAGGAAAGAPAGLLGAGPAAVVGAIELGVCAGRQAPNSSARRIAAESRVCTFIVLTSELKIYEALWYYATHM